MDIGEQSVDKEDVSELLLLGLGGAGINIVERIYEKYSAFSKAVVVDTDLRSLHECSVPNKLQIGSSITRGLSTGSDIELGKKAIQEQSEDVRKLFSKQQLVFLVCGLGGGTGSAACAKIAELASDEGAIVVALVTTPFILEGIRRKQIAEGVISDLNRLCHVVIPLGNDALSETLDKSDSYLKALSASDQWIVAAVNALSSMFLKRGIINIDRATFESAFSVNDGKTLFSFGRGSGGDAANEALEALATCPLLHLPENNYHRQTDTLIVHIAGGLNLTQGEVDQILSDVNNRFSSKDETIIAARCDADLEDCIEITVIGSSVTRSKKSAIATPVENHHSVPAAHNWPSRQEMEKKNRRRRKKPDIDGQETFNFPREEDCRGIFEQSPVNMFENVDLDIPTFIRQNIKINY